MLQTKWWLFGGAVAAVAVWAVCSPRTQFLMGGAMINLGYRLQDPHEAYDFVHQEATPEEIWSQFLSQNFLASSIRDRFPRTVRHPVAAMVVCMDARLDTNEIAGDTRRYYYVLRTAGSVLAPKEEEMLELAVANGVKVIVFTTHTDCAAEKAAANPASRAQFPHLSRAIDEREMRFREFQELPSIQAKIAEKKLLVKWMDLDTRDERVHPLHQ
jgi:carbonic anhydrase